MHASISSPVTLILPPCEYIYIYIYTYTYMFLSPSLCFLLAFFLSFFHSLSLLLMIPLSAEAVRLHHHIYAADGATPSSYAAVRENAQAAAFEVRCPEDPLTSCSGGEMGIPLFKV